MLGTAPLPCDGSAATTASGVTNSCASTPSRDSCFQSTLWMSETTSYPALAEVRKPQVLGPTGICLPSLSFQTPYAPVPTSALWYNTVVLALSPISILAFPSCPCMEEAYTCINPSHLFHSRSYFDLCVPPCLFLPPDHGHRNGTSRGNGTHHGREDMRCNPELVLSALLADNHGAIYAFSGERCHQLFHLWPSYLPSLHCVSHL